MTSNNAGLKGLRGTLEATLESDDISPLLKLITSVGPRQAGDGGGSTSPPPLHHHSPRDEIHTIAEGTLSAVVQTLQGIAERRQMELLRTTEANAGDITAAMHELTTVQTIATELRRRSHEITASMQRVGSHFSSRLDALNEANSAKEKIKESRAALAAAAEIVSLCDDVAQSVDAGQLFHARRVLTSLKAKYGAALKAGAGAGTAHVGGSSGGERKSSTFSSSAAPGASVPPPPLPPPSTTVESAAAAAQLGTFSARLVKRIQELESLLDARLASALNEWLTEARAAARRVGESALEIEGKLKEQEESSARQRRALFKSLEVSTKTVPLSRSSSTASSRTVSLNNTPRVAVVVVSDKNLVRRKNTDEGACQVVDPVTAVDMTLLLRCIHVHSLDGTLQQLLETYVEARQAQLGADLAPPPNFIGNHRAFFWQILGFFLIESRVAALAPQLESRAHAAAAWEGAAAALAAEIGAAIDEAAKPDDIRELKNQAVLACDALDRWCGGALSTRGIRSTLTTRAGKHRARMTTDIAAALDAAEGDAGAIQRAVARVVEECTEYLFGLVAPSDLPGAIYRECDQALAGALAAKVAAFAVAEQHISSSSSSSEREDDGDGDDSEEESAGSSEEESGSSYDNSYNDEDDDLKSGAAFDSEDESYSEDDSDASEGSEEGHDDFMELLLLITTAAAAEQALETVGRELFGGSGGGGGGGGESTPLPSSSTQLNGALLATEETAGKRIARGANPAVEALADLEWTPLEIPHMGKSITPQCTEIMEVFQAGLVAVQHSGVPSSSLERILRAALRATSENVLRLLASDAAVPCLNAYSAQRLLSDVDALSKFAVEWATGGGVVAVAGLAELRLMCEAVAFNSADELLDPGVRAEKYSSVNLDRVAALLDKVVDVEGRGSVVMKSSGVRVLGKREAGRVAEGLRKALLAERTA